MWARLFLVTLLGSVLLLGGSGFAFGQQPAMQNVKITTGKIELYPLAPFGSMLPDSIFTPKKLYYCVAATDKPYAINNILSPKSFVQAAEKLAPGVYIIGFAAMPNKEQLIALGISHVSPIGKLPKTNFTRINSFPAYSVTAGRAKLWLFPLPSYSTEDLIAVLGQQGIASSKTAFHNQPIVEAICSQNQLDQLLSMPEIMYLEPAPAADKVLNENSRAQAAYFSTNSNAPGSPMLTGKGVVVGIGDDSDPTLHPDFKYRVINHTPGIVNNHGAHVTGTAAGAGILQPSRAGYAPDATIVSQFFSGILQNAGTYVSDYGMVLTNNSYGTIAGECDKNGIYTLQSRILDLQAAQFPSLLHMFASGNDGNFTCAPYPQHYGTVLQGYQVAKNIITVGRTDYSQLSSASSSSGPVRDGRIKPEITALGEAISSTRGQYAGPGSAYYQEWGTSMSAPAITGGLAQLYQRYKELHSGGNPSGALMKAILLNGARDLGTPGPDFRHGFGSMHLGNSLRMLDQQTWTTQTVGTGGANQQQITVANAPAALRVMLYWHDPAANPLATKTLVNDLDLEVIAPGGQTFLPLILNTSPAGVANAATPGTDRINNVEQVVIANPVVGSYTLRVRGHEVLGTQAYALVWDTLPAQLQVTNPVAGQVWTSGNSIPITWNDFSETGGSYNIAFSADGGANWADIATNLPSTTRFFEYAPAVTLATTNALVRITKGSNSVTGAAFTLINAPTPTAPAAEQCPGYIKMNWNAVTGAEAYAVLMQQNGKMQTIATVGSATLTYLFGGLHTDSTYHIAVVPIINGQQGRYRQALEIRANAGTCSLPIYDNDLALDSIIAPRSGRQFTTTALSANETIRVRIRNRDNAAATSFSIQYRINGGSFVQQNNVLPIAANAEYVHEFTGVNLSAPGDYLIEAVVKNAADDPNALNDTFRISIRQLTNAVINLTTPVQYNFDNLPATTTQRSTLGVAGSQAWDYAAFDNYSRLRTLVTSGIARSGNRAITLDVSKAGSYLTNPINHFTGTFNLSNYSTANDIRFDFWWQQHGIAQQPHPQNKIWARGSDTDAWVEIFDLGVNQPPLPGQYKASPSIPLSQKLQEAGQQLSASTQIRIGQHAIFGMADATHYAGYTFDDMQLLIAVNDVQLVGIDSSLLIACGLGNTVPVTIRLANTAINTLTNVPVRYKVNNGVWVNEVVPSIPARDSVNFTFTQPAALAGNGQYSITVEVLAPGDNVKQNNTITLLLANQPVITQYPYLQDFEQNEGAWFAGGINSSWQYGTPASTAISTAASGQKAWKTTLAGLHNDNELSYLYSPCFNIQGLNTPMLSFSVAYDIEDCRQFNVLCDGAWVEYSTDGVSWQKLGSSGSGTNWYDNSKEQAWTQRNQTYWHVATIFLPKVNSNIRLRFVMASDDFTTREGIAVDDIHVYDLHQPVYALQTNSDSLVQNVLLNQWVNFNSQNMVMASVKNTNNEATQLGVKTWVHTGDVRSLNKAYYSQRNLTIQSNAANNNNVNADIRFYITDEEVDVLRRANTCSDCSPIKDFTQLNVQRYSRAGEEDGDLFNNNTGIYTAIPPQLTKRVPYANGYYYEFATTGLSEWWLTNAAGTPPALAATYINFKVLLVNGLPQLQWETANEKDVLQYRIEASLTGDNSFTPIANVAAKNELNNNYIFDDIRKGLRGRVYYRLARIDASGEVHFSQVQSVVIPGTKPGIVIAPVPATTFIIIVANNMPDGRYEAKITTALGQTVWTGIQNFVNGNTGQRISVAALSAGWYLLTLRGSDGVQTTQKFQVVRH